MTEKAWQLGYPLDDLKAIAAPFKEMLEPHCYGAFGRPTRFDLESEHMQSRARRSVERV